MHGDRPPSDKRLPPHYIGPVIIKWKNKSATLSEQVIFLDLKMDLFRQCGTFIFPFYFKIVERGKIPPTCKRPLTFLA
jgi:hypothetical protein